MQEEVTEPGAETPAGPDPVLKLAKLAVLVLTILLVTGVAALAVMLAKKQMGRVGAESAVSALPALSAVAPHAVLPLPEGSRVRSMSSGERYVDLLVEGADGVREIYQVERATGRVAGVIRLQSKTR